MKDEKVLMFSGGLDSTIAWFYLGQPKAVFVYLGHRYGASEYFTAQALAKRLKMDLVVEKRLYLGDKETPDAYIPMRNMFLAMIGALYGDKIYMVFQRGEQSIADRSPQFLAGASKILSFLNGYPITVESPFMNITKARMIEWYLKKGYPVDVLYKTFSCFCQDSQYAPCGECSACFRRWIAFQYNGLDLTFQKDIKQWSGIGAYVQKMTAGVYDTERVLETRTVLERWGLWK